MVETKVFLVTTKENNVLKLALCYAFFQLQLIITVGTVILPRMFALTGYLFYLSISNGNTCLDHIPGRGSWAGCLTIIPRARMGPESIAHEAEGQMGY